MNDTITITRRAREGESFVDAWKAAANACRELAGRGEWAKTRTRTERRRGGVLVRRFTFSRID